MNPSYQSNIVYYPTSPQTVYVQAVPVYLQTNKPPAYNPYLHQHLNQIVPTTDTKISSVELPQLWLTGLLDCFSDCGVCLCGCFCPCCLYGKNAKKMYDSSCFCSCLSYVFCCGPFQQCQLRKDLRKRYNLLESPCNDCCVSFCCGPCALCQEARELNYRLINSPTQQNMH